MASLALASAVIGAAGTAISAISKANALRAQARARQIEGEQELLSSKRLLRQELGEQAVAAGASGLLGSSFAGVFESQAIEDAEFLGRIKQRTDFDVANLKRQSKLTLITGAIGVGAQAAGGVARVRGQEARVAAAEEQRVALLRASPGSRLVPGGNIFGAKGGSTSPFKLRRARTATFV